jgi:hypothetical protein
MNIKLLLLGLFSVFTVVACTDTTTVSEDAATVDASTVSTNPTPVLLTDAVSSIDVVVDASATTSSDAR